jgi:hydroxyacylglutathione hydrolase
MSDAPESVTPSEAHELVERGEAIIVDVRDASAHAEGHIAGSVNIPIGELSDRMDELPTDTRIITSCGGGTRGPRAAAQLRELGIEADVVTGGLRAWSAADLPVE